MLSFNGPVPRDESAAISDLTPHLIRPAPPNKQVARSREEMLMSRLAGKVALITGSGTGIGRATAKAMAAEGAKVVIAELNKAAGEQVAQVIAQAGGECIAVPTDVTDEASMKAAVEMARSHYGALHMLHNNAGGSTNIDRDRRRRADRGVLARHPARPVRHVPGLSLRHSGDHQVRRRFGDQHVV